MTLSPSGDPLSPSSLMIHVVLLIVRLLTCSLLALEVADAVVSAGTGARSAVSILQETEPIQLC